VGQLEVLWTNGQQRLTREQKGRMTEGFVFTRDALVEVMGAIYGAKSTGELPSYTQSEVKKSRGLTGADLDRALASWQLEYPERVN